eukprot:EG_transcript_4970
MLPKERVWAYRCYIIVALVPCVFLLVRQGCGVQLHQTTKVLEAVVIPKSLQNPTNVLSAFKKEGTVPLPQIPSLHLNPLTPRQSNSQPMSIKSTLGDIFRIVLIGAAALIAWHEVRPRKQWHMSALGDEKAGSKSSVLNNLDSILGDETFSTPNKDGSHGDAHPPKAKSTLLSLQDLFGDDPPVAKGEEKSTALKDVPETMPSRDEQAKAVSGDLYKKLSTIKSEKDVEDIRLQTKELVDLVTMRDLQRRIPREDVKRMKDEVLANSNFWLSTAEDALEFTRTGFVGGHLFRGHVRGDTTKVLQDIQQRTKQVFNGKYEVVVIPEPPKYDFDDDFWTDVEGQNTNPALLLISSEEVNEAPLTTFQYGVAVLLAMATLFTIYLTAFGVGLTDLDPAQLQSLAEAGNSQALEDLLAVNLAAISRLAIPVGIGILSSAFSHEVAHRVAAAKYRVKLSPPYFLPSLNLGTLGGVTRLRTLAPSKAALFDIAASGPVAGLSSAFVFFLAGIALTSTAAPGDPSLVAVPEVLLSSSVALGGLLKSIYGSGAVNCHPFVLAGWCGMITSALNCLPLGSTDGGRIMQSVFGRAAKQFASFMTYIMLGLDLLAPGVGFTWGITTIFLQRGNERNVQDQFTAVDSARRNVAIGLFLLSVVLLLPSPDAIFTQLPPVN